MKLAILALLAGAAFGADGGKWIVEHGGTVESEGGSKITAASVGFQWFTDLEVDRIAGLQGDLGPRFESADSEGKLR